MSGPPPPSVTVNISETLYQHVCLPPNLPGHFDATERLDRGLFDRLVTACKTIKGQDTQRHETWDNLRQCLETSRTLNWLSKLDAKNLSEQFARLRQDDFIILRVTEQNAGLFICRREDETGDNVFFDSFEASPLSEHVLAADVLAMDFPSSSVAMPFDAFLEMREHIAVFLDQASSESLREFAAKTFKAGTSSREIRDTTNPALITELLSTILEANGVRNYPSLMRKHVRDDVCWKNADRPWRRSPMWLILRVSIQLHLVRLHGPELGRSYYKLLLVVFLANLLNEWTRCMGPDSVALARTKLGRRIAKLVEDRRNSSPQVQPILTTLFSSFETVWSNTLQNANRQIDEAWSDFKRRTRKQIPQLSQTAEPHALKLSLRNSRPYLDQVLQEWHAGGLSDRGNAAQKSEAASSSRFSEFIQQNLRLVGFEERVRNRSGSFAESLCSSLDGSEAVIKLSSQICHYIDLVASLYDSDPIHKSQKILTVFDLWTQMDCQATRLYPVLREYHTGFSVESLEVLLLPDFEDMERLQRIEDYISHRNRYSNSTNNIFHSPCRHCFAERYFDHTPELQGILEQIENWKSEQRAATEAEWREKSAQYETLSTEIADLSCVYVANEDDFNRLMHAPNCRKCYKERCRKRLRVNIFEDPLSSDLSVAKATIFELCCPLPLAAYRDCTWLILGALGDVNPTSSVPPNVLLRDYTPLKKWNQNASSHVTLASSKKSFTQTHYGSLRLPIDLDELFKRCGLYLSYYDSSQNLWLGGRGPLTFSRSCGLNIPMNSPYSALHSFSQFAPGAPGPSSYSIVASQASCPPALAAHEFVAYQSLYSSQLLRWHCILLELASSNVNFSSEAPSLLVSHLACQVGPNKRRPTRDYHLSVCDQHFCHKLLHQIQTRMCNIRANWREIHCMDMLLTLLLRLWTIRRGGLPDHMETPSLLNSAMLLLTEARDITLEWIRLLRTEALQAKDAESSRVINQYAFWSAMLCRRTYTIFKGADSIPRALVGAFFRISITLRDNLPTNIFNETHRVKSALRRDIKLVSQLQPLLRRALSTNPQCFLEGLDLVLPQPDGAEPRLLSSSSLPVDEDNCWFQAAIIGNRWARGQTLRYHLLQGILLVDNKPVGKLPQEHTRSTVVQRLFGYLNLRTAPSSCPGMQYQIQQSFEGHVVHLGLRNDSLIARAFIGKTVLEYIPHETFLSCSDFDLPAPLIDGCIHWLDLNSKVIEIRQHKWQRKSSDWKLDLNRSLTTRRQSILVDPNSFYFQRLASIFRAFERPDQLVVYQKKERVYCEIRRMSLSFSVSRQGLLHCRQYGIVDRNQDVGTFYGLESKLVFKDASSAKKRLILVPNGQVNFNRNGIHIAVSVSGNGSFSTYTVNEVLGRVDCPAEPVLVYAKALFHALTSFPVSDPLMGRTGMEEAIDFLSSGICQPWGPLSIAQSQLLKTLAQLSPRRQYYPSDRKVMQTVHWNPNLPVAVHHEAFRFIVDSIYQVSRNLSTFALRAHDDLPELEPNGDSFLLTRARVRRAPYERSPFIRSLKTVPKVEIYEARAGPKASWLLSKIYNIVSLILHEAPFFGTTRDLVQCLQRFPVIGGFDRAYNKTLFSSFRVEMELEWGSLVNFCRSANKSDKSKLMFLFALLLYAHPGQEELIHTLLAYLLMDDMKRVSLPPWPSYTNFHPRLVPTVDAFAHLILPFRVPYVQPELTDMAFVSDRRTRARLIADECNYARSVENDTQALAEYLVHQWPSVSLSFDGFSSEFIRVQDAANVLVPEWERLVHNRDLLLHLQHVQQILNAHAADTRFPPPRHQCRTSDRLPERSRNGEVRDLSAQLIGKEALRLPNKVSTISINTFETKDSNPKPTSINERDTNDNTVIRELRSIVAELGRNESNVYQKYTMALNVSIDALVNHELKRHDRATPLNSSQLAMQINAARQTVNQHFVSLYDTFTRDDALAKWLQLGGLYPPVTTVTLLQQLRSSSPRNFGPNMKELVTTWAVSITVLQRLLRIEDALCRGDMDRADGELQNCGHENWSPLDKSDWLLLEIDSNILLRSGQVDVALETILPRSGSNSVLQMNMGQGKTSCVIPMAALILANKKQLVRVIVPKALLLQTAQLLQSRIGGLLGRHIVHVPFARKTSTAPETINLFGSIHAKTMRHGGIVLALPEHMLSFSLSGLQRLTDGRLLEASPMIKGQSWLQKVCRDIMDESDFTLACRTQLIYPSGSQVALDGGGHRWEATELLLDLVKGHLPHLQTRFRSSIQVVERHDGYPIVYFLHQDVQNELLRKLTENICSGHFPLVPMRNCTPMERSTIRTFLTDDRISQTTLTHVFKLYPDRPTVRNILFLLRGLLVHRILLMSLSRRWNVQYGLHPERDPVAVPFTAKGVPSESAEWGHPDVCILFTVLSFYYSGLNFDQVRQVLEHVLKSDDPAAQYETWTSGIPALPDSMREIFSINPEDATQMKELTGYLRYHTRIVDCFLNAFVFPRHAKQFQKKLQASGWDLPLFSFSKDQRALTTGFSGTNDNRDMLPLNIKQHDLPSLAHTNAEVLTYLLQPRNRRYFVAAHGDGRRLTEIELLRRLKAENIRILIDAGAQVLELDNLGLVRQWLQVENEAPAAVYFDSGNKAMVFYRNEAKVPLVASPFADNLGDALLYLDEAHTRGTDLKLPKRAVAGLTLGLGQTKDSTVQAAMRCRELGTTQSVVWIGTPEVHQSILQIRSELFSRPVNSCDVIFWLLSNTCVNLSQLQPLYYAQGVNFCERMQAAFNSRAGLLDDECQRRLLVDIIQSQERMSLEELYCPRRRGPKPNTIRSFIPELGHFRRELEALRKDFKDAGGTTHPSALQEVEQEREVAYEVEAVRQVQKPVRYKALSFPGLNKDLVLFANTGRISARSAAYENAFFMLQRTGLGNKHTINTRAMRNTRVFCSVEFGRTVKEASTAPLNHLQRNINWVLWSPVSETAIVVIPEEAEGLLPILRDSDDPVCFLLTYSAPSTRKMLGYFNDMTFYAVPALPADWRAPRWLTVSLGLLAGRLYFDFEEYQALINFLGVHEPSSQSPDNNTIGFQDGGFEITVETLAQPENESIIAASVLASEPFAFLQDWLDVRRNGQDFTNTPMGFVCHGKILTADHPFFSEKRIMSVQGPVRDSDVQTQAQDTIAANDVADNHSENDMLSLDEEFEEGMIEDMEMEDDEDVQDIAEDNGDIEFDDTSSDDE